MSKRKYEYYGVWFVKEQRGKVFDSWTEYQTETKGITHRMKGFHGKEEAESWFKEEAEKDKKSVKKAEKQKFYALHFIDTKQNRVLKTWDECLSLSTGRQAMYKKFDTEEDAEKWLSSITPDAEQHYLEMRDKNILKRKNNKEYKIFIPDDLAKKFDKKLMQMQIDADTVIADFIREWVDI